MNYALIALFSQQYLCLHFVLTIIHPAFLCSVRASRANRMLFPSTHLLLLRYLFAKSINWTYHFQLVFTLKTE